jgi:hypothetical protein
LLIPGTFWFASDLHAGGNATAGERYSSPGIKKIPPTHLVCAPGIAFYPWRTSNRCAGDKISKNPKTIKISKIFLNCKNLNNMKNCAYMIF